MDYDTDGIYFIDEKGNKSIWHPSKIKNVIKIEIDYFVQEYLELENKKIDEYNHKSKEEIDSHRILI